MFQRPAPPCFNCLATSVNMYVHTMQKQMMVMVRPFGEATLEDGLQGVVRFDASPAGHRRLFSALPEAVRQKALQVGAQWELEPNCAMIPRQ